MVMWTDGAAAMTTRISGATVCIKSCQSKDYCYSLYVAAESTCLQSHGTRSVLDTAAPAVHFVKSRALQSRLFGDLCWNMDAQHDAPQ